MYDKIKKETLSLYIKGEEEAITKGNKEKNPIEIGGRKLKKGGLIAIYNERRVDAEAAIQQREIRTINRGEEINRITPSVGRLSIFDIMNQSVESVINDFKKLNLDSSPSNKANSEINPNPGKNEPSLKNETKINTNNSSILDDNNEDSGKSVIIKGNNSELNKRRRIN